MPSALPHRQLAAATRELHAASDLLAGVHYRVQDLSHELRVPMPAVLATLGHLAQVTLTLHDQLIAAEQASRAAATADP
ncbi:hypothetical protein DSM112329_02954 [Paraconexibacter sp. AEG42_29]|uniref:Signal transduction histidine kinase dimerisation/phosphoacceptor domain-containing protein n=1 Tax=Paraconexibacter sp. AEG42_29 TaxID=2997339 RepID=A0AAU7AWP9_9ACTN